MIGDSIGAGQGAGGPAGALPAGVTWNDTGGSVITNWPVASSVLGTFITRMMGTHGITDLHVYRQAVATIESTEILTGYLDQVIARARSDGREPDVILICCGTNDSSAGESYIMPGLLASRYDNIEQSFPQARIIHFSPCVLNTFESMGNSWPESLDVVGYIAAECSRVGTRHHINGYGRSTGDGVHPDLTTYQDFGNEGADAYASGP